MNKELIERLRGLKCDCPIPQKKTACSIHREAEAADAIESLQKENTRLHELHLDRTKLTTKMIQASEYAQSQVEAQQGVIEVAKKFSNYMRAQDRWEFEEALAKLD